MQRICPSDGTSVFHAPFDTSSGTIAASARFEGQSWTTERCWPFCWPIDFYGCFSCMEHVFALAQPPWILGWAPSPRHANSAWEFWKNRIWSETFACCLWCYEWPCKRSGYSGKECYIKFAHSILFLENCASQFYHPCRAYKVSSRTCGGTSCNWYRTQQYFFPITFLFFPWTHPQPTRP